MKGARVRYLILGLVTTITVLLDQATKLHIMQTVRLHESIPIIGGFFNLTYIRNPGAAFGLLASTGPVFRTIFFGLASLFALGLLATIFFRLQPDDRAGQLSVAATLGGALGNLTDRVMRGGEGVDFLDFHLAGYTWPTFNAEIGRAHV